MGVFCGGDNPGLGRFNFPMVVEFATGWWFSAVSHREVFNKTVGTVV